MTPFEILGAAASTTVDATKQMVKATSPVPARVLEPNRDLKTITHQVVPALLAGVVGALLVPKHPYLGFIGAAAAAGSVYPLTKSEERKEAVVRLGVVGAGIAGSLMWKKHRVLGYALPAVGAAFVLPKVAKAI